MVDLNSAYQDAKYLSDDDLKKELSSPTGMIPGYIVMSELQDRQSIRAGTGGSPDQKSMKDELLGQPSTSPQSAPVRQYSKGGIIAQLNPFNAMADAMRNPQLMGGYLQDALNNQSGGLPALQAAQAPGAPQPVPTISSLQPTPAGAPQAPIKYAMGGIASLYRG